MLVGRARELDAITGILGGLKSGRGGTLLFSGEPGIGKTALLGHARAVAADTTVLSSTGMEAEAALPYAALVDLATPLVDHIDALAPAQRGAVAAALAMEGAGPGSWDRLATCAGFLSLLRLAALEQPVLLVVDDAHWLDAPSAECLGYVARRLDQESVALVVASRSEEIPDVLRGRGVVEHVVEPLSGADAVALVTDDGAVASYTAERIVEAAHGNPLALTEMLDGLTAEQRNGAVAYEPTLRPGSQLSSAFGGRVDGLDGVAHAAALLVALAYDHQPTTVLAAIEAADLPRSALEEGERAGLVVADGERITLRHPLMRAAILSRADAPAIRNAHATLAAVSAPDPAAWHLAEAALGPAAEVADALDAAGWRAVQRGAHLVAGEAFERAGALTPDDDRRLQRGFFAAVQFGFGGAYERAALILDRLTHSAEDELAHAARHIHAIVGLVGATRPVLDHLDVLESEADLLEAAQPLVAAPLLADAAMVAVVGGECRRALAYAERAATILPPDAPPLATAQVYSMLGMGRALLGDTAGARVALAGVGPLLPQIDALSPMAGTITFGLHAQICTGDTAEMRDDVLAMAGAVRESGANGLVPHYLLVAADAALRLGRWDEADADIEEAVATAELCGQRGPLAAALVVRSRLRAARGDRDGVCADLDVVVAIAKRAGYVTSGVGAQAVRGFLELSDGRIANAIDELESVAAAAERAGMVDPITIPWAPDLVEAYAAAGRSVDARTLAATLTTRAKRSGAPLALALAARCSGLVAEAFDAPFQEALEHHRAVEAPFEEARTLLLLGGRLHRARRRAEARERLRAARVIFQRLRAQPWVERVTAELVAAGAAERGHESGDDELTAHERRIALAVAAGATNREVAAELYLSPKTVEFHLSRIYRKLGIRSRTQLAALAADGGLDAVSTP